MPVAMNPKVRLELLDQRVKIGRKSGAPRIVCKSRSQLARRGEMVGHDYCRVLMERRQRWPDEDEVLLVLSLRIGGREGSALHGLWTQ